MVNIAEDRIRIIGKVLNDENRPLKERFRALFTLRNIGGPVAIQCIQQCFGDSSALLKHELAYCMGQMQDKAAIPVLIKVLEDISQEPMVRHEAAEALGAIGSPEVLDVLEKYRKDPVIEVAETCDLAINRIKWLGEKRESENLPDNPYHSVDPTPPAPTRNVAELKNILFDENAALFDRYRAMFSLRNLRSKEAIDALGEALKYGGALFRHEVAFVFGQLQDKDSIKYLKESLEDSNENEMVRHECAEALGSIATSECFEILNKYMNDEKRVVKESCEIALDMCEYENSPEFQYANTLQTS